MYSILWSRSNIYIHVNLPVMAAAVPPHGQCHQYYLALWIVSHTLFPHCIQDLKKVWNAYPTLGLSVKQG